MITPSRLHGFVGTCFPSPLCGSPVGCSGCVSFKLDDVGAAFGGGVDFSAGLDPWSQEADNSRTPNKKPSVYRSHMLFPPLEGQAALLHSLSSYAGLWRRLLDKALVPSFADGLRQSNHIRLKRSLYAASSEGVRGCCGNYTSMILRISSHRERSRSETNYRKKSDS